jgi:AraC-like DNA-binding protein
MRPERIAFADVMPVKAFVRQVEQYPYHWHDTLEIMQVLEGEVNISLGDHELLMRKNDVAVTNIDEVHRITGGGMGNRILFIHIDGDFCRNVLPEHKYLFIYCCSAYHEARAPEKYKALKEYIARLVQGLGEKVPGERAKNVQDVLTPMLSYLTYNFELLRWGFGTTPLDDKRVDRLKRIAERMRCDPDVKPGLKALAVEAGVTLQHLSYDIKNRFGLTFQELLYYGKCEEAAKLLLSTDRRIVDIALECGFSDAKYLIKHFKQYFQCTPSVFRKTHMADTVPLSSQTRFKDFPFSYARRLVGSGDMSQLTEK